MSDALTQLHYGRVSVRRKGSTKPPFELGAMRAVGFTPEQNEITIADPRSRTNSELDGVSRPSGGALEGELLELPPESLVALLAGNRVEIPQGAVANEPARAMVRRTTMTKYLPVAIAELASADGSTVYEAGRDYVKSPGGFRVLAGGDLAADILASPLDAEGERSLPVVVSYSYPKTDLIHAFTQGRQYYEVFIETLNEAGQLEGRRIFIRRARIALSGAFPLINRDDFAAIGVKFALSEDPDFFGADESALMT
ncbi:hypothetical protein, partial [Pseudomonas sp. RIT-PI-AD]|uniref:hypothetical protein n=1 Tax=Pseudomonas sp. RIT-PI-AD TaxID=3035294 RepID=UPI0021D8CBFA